MSTEQRGARTGIDAISFYTPRYFIDLKTLAAARGVDPDKFYVGIGQERMSIAPPDEDIVTMGASAALPIIGERERAEIDLVLFATESGIDQSKAAGIFVHGLLGLSESCRVVELKQACYSCTVGLRMAAAMIACGYARRALVIAADIARYELESPGEATQGAGAVAMVVADDARILRLDPEAGCYTSDVMDFWRPNYREEALVDGKYSTLVYITALRHAWAEYKQASGRGLEDFRRFCYHIPFTKMAEKAHGSLAKKELGQSVPPAELRALMDDTLAYSRSAGNCYSASLYVGLTSLLDNAREDLGGARIGLFSYGSGCVGEFFSGVVQDGYRALLRSRLHHKLLEEREELDCRQYEDIYHLDFPGDGGEHEFARYRTGAFRLAGVSGHKRRYERLESEQ
jgi:hydroxymethylglutaryl-CoA synthase